MVPSVPKYAQAPSIHHKYVQSLQHLYQHDGDRNSAMSSGHTLPPACLCPAVATATMPLAAGLVGIIPALGLLTPEEHPSGPVTFTPWQLLAWCSALAFFGVFVAVPLRYQTIILEKLRFPSGTATASVIRTLHGLPAQQTEAEAADVHAGGSSSGDGGGHGSAAVPAWMKQRASDDEFGAQTDPSLGQRQQQQQRQLSDGFSTLPVSSSSSTKGLNQVDLEVAVWVSDQLTLLQTWSPWRTHKQPRG